MIVLVLNIPFLNDLYGYIYEGIKINDFTDTNKFN